MITSAYKNVSQSVYALVAGSSGGTQSRATAFAIAPGILATVAHVLYRNAGDSSSIQDKITVLRLPEIKPGSQFEEAQFAGMDSEYDIALIKVQEPLNNSFLSLTTTAPVASRVGTVGFPQIFEEESQISMARFQGGYISASYGRKSEISDRWIIYHETDFPMYIGSSGSPGFLSDGKVFGLHVAALWSRTENRSEQRAFSLWVPASAIQELAKKNHITLTLA